MSFIPSSAAAILGNRLRSASSPSTSFTARNSGCSIFSAASVSRKRSTSARYAVPEITLSPTRGDLAASITRAISSFTPVPFSALIGTTGTPSAVSSAPTSISSPSRLSASVMLSATTTGISASSTCVVR